MYHVEIFPTTISPYKWRNCKCLWESSTV